MGRQQRHLVITDILSGESPPSQEALRTALAQRGLEVTQATLSRDLRTLGVVKGPRGYLAPPSPRDELSHAGYNGADSTMEANPGQPGFRGELVAEFVTRVETGGQMVVIRTGPGRAQAVAYEIDYRPLDGVLGTVAGDDTIFVCTADAKEAGRVAKSFQTAFGLARSASGGAS